MRPKAFVGSSASVWASETIQLRHRHPDIFECPVKSDHPSYSSGFRTVCAEIHDAMFQYTDMTEPLDLRNAVTLPDCLEYEVRRVKHAQNLIEQGVQQFCSYPTIDMRHKSLFQDEVLPFATECLAGLDTMLSSLQSHDNIDDKE